MCGKENAPAYQHQNLISNVKYGGGWHDGLELLCLGMDGLQKNGFPTFKKAQQRMDDATG